MCQSRFISVMATLIVLFPSAPSAADYGALTLFQLLSQSEVAVNGTVRVVEDGRYDLAVTKVLDASQVPQTLAVQRSDTYPPGTRSGDFIEGQGLTLLALSDGNELVRPLGRAAEGELPRVGGNVYIRAMARPPDNVTRTAVPGTDRTAYRIDADIFDHAVQGFYDCYRSAEPDRIERHCTDAEREAFRATSWLAAHLAGIADRLVPEGE